MSLRVSKMPKYSALKRSIWGVFSTVLLLYSNAQAQTPENIEDEFDEIDAQLEQAFVQTDAELEAVFEAVNQAIQAAFTGQTKNIEVKWPSNVVVPSGTQWVVYSQDYEQRVVYDFEEGFYKLEVPKSADTLKNIVKLHELYAKLKADKANAIQEMDVFKKAIESELESLPELVTTDNFDEPTTTSAVEGDTLKTSTEVIQESNIANYELINSVTEIPTDIALETLQREMELLNAAVDNQKAISEPSQLIEPKKESSLENSKTDERKVEIAEAQSDTPATESITVPEAPVKEKVSLPSETLAVLTKPLPTPEPEKTFELQETDTTISLKFPFVNGYQKTLVEQRMDTINEMSKRFDVETSLVMAIIEAESSFNPMATSHIPAFGLMQLVPKTAGIDAYKFVYGEGKVVTPDYLYNIENNLKLGTAYLSLLQTRYLRGIEKPSNLLYSTIASYNTGVGNLARSVSGQKGIRKAIPAINQISDEEYFDYLQQNLPALETKRYLQKVIKNKQKYEYLD